MGRVSKRIHGSADNGVDLGTSLLHKGRCYKAGIYARLSSNQDSKTSRQASKSESIEVQIEIAKKYVEDWNHSHADRIEVAECYTDLGKTGTNFNRNAFMRLMQDVRMGDINCVIVKDLSRFGRNYLEAGNYIEKIFPFLGVRFIAVADGYDTGADGNDTKQMVSEIKNLVNDMYAKDFSVKARTSLAQRRQEGSYVGGPPPYGYQSTWEGKLRRLVPDENTAEIVRYIYRKFIETESYTAVANDLNRRRINPSAVYRGTGEVYCPPEMPYKGWDKSAVERIVRSRTYMGELVQGKTSITAKNEKSRIHKSENEWVVTENAHEPLIRSGIFEQAEEVCQRIQERTINHAHPSEGCPIEENIFDKVLYCGVCGRKMTRHSYVQDYADGSRKRMDGYHCLNGKNSKTDTCPASNRISKMELTEIIFSLLGAEFVMHLGRQKTYVKSAEEKVQKKKLELERNLRSVRNVMERLSAEESEKYMAYRIGSLSQKDYVAYRIQKEDRMREMEKQESQYREQISELERDGEEYLKAVRALVKLKNRQVLTKELIETLIGKIYVYPGKRVEVLFRYSDAWMERVVGK